MKIPMVLFAAPLLAAARPAWSQAAHLAGRVDVDLPRGGITADLCLRSATRGDSTRFALNPGMNVKRVRNAAGNALPFSTRYDAGVARYAVRDTARAGTAAPGGICVEYTGAFPVYDVRANDYRDEDNPGVIAFNGSTLRASGGTGWYPVPLDSAAGEAHERLTYAIRVRCPACARLYVSGAPPRDGPEADFASDVPRNLLLWIGDYPAVEVDGTTFLGEAVSVDTARMFLARIGEIRRFFEQLVGVPYGRNPDVLGIAAVNRVGRYQFWAFFPDPALVLVGRVSVGDFVEVIGNPAHPGRGVLLGVLAHELAHRYFPGTLAPGGAYRGLFSEPFATYLELRARRRFAGEESYRAGLADRRFLALGGPDLPALDTASTTGIESARYLYGLAPLLLVALEAEVGEARMNAFLRALLTAPAAERRALDYAAMRRIALRSGISPQAWDGWERRCVRPPPSLNGCLVKLPDS